MDARWVSSLQSGRGQAAGPTYSVPEARASGGASRITRPPKKNGANTRPRIFPGRTRGKTERKGTKRNFSGTRFISRYSLNFGRHFCVFGGSFAREREPCWWPPGTPPTTRNLMPSIRIARRKIKLFYFQRITMRNE